MNTDQQSQMGYDEESKVSQLIEPLINPSINYDRDQSIAGDSEFLRFRSLRERI